jgi:uncharacterized protein (DUF2141 family)
MVRKVFFVLVVMFFAASVQAQSKVTVNITNVRNDKGVCKVCLFNNAASFNGEGGNAYACLNVPVKAKTSTATFNNVAAGTYAVMVFHDANTNNKMDKNFLGIPSEGYGASLNKLPFAAAPNFNDNKFVVENNAAVGVKIKMRNL